MTPERLKMIQKKLKLSAAEFGIVLGYSGERATIGASVRRLTGSKTDRAVPEKVARLAAMYELHGVPDDIAKRASK